MPTRNELLADYYLKVSGVAGVSIDPDGQIKIHDVITSAIEPGRVLYCCLRGRHMRLAMAAARFGDKTQKDAAQRICEVARTERIGITDHAMVVERALAAVDQVNRTIAELQRTGKMADFNREFKHARKQDPTLKYMDRLHARKARMLDALGRLSGT